MKLFALALLLVFFSCSNELELDQKSGIFFVKDVEVGMDNLQNVEWLVGKEREAEISKGLKMDVEVPKISQEAAQLLWQKHGIDSWLYRITKITRGSRRHIGYVAIDSRSAEHIAKSFTLHLYYHAASVSREFRRFRCPAFNHRKFPTQFSLVDNKSNARKDLFARSTESILGEVSRISFSPLIFSAGASLEGDYLIEVALFNSKDKKLFSSWLPLSHRLEVKTEMIKSVQSCMGINEELNPLPGSRSLRIEDLQIR